MELGDDLAGLRIGRRKQRRRSVPLQACVRRSIRPGCIGSSGCVRSTAWICGFSSTQNTAACAEGSQQKAVGLSHTAISRIGHTFGARAATHWSTREIRLAPGRGSS